MKPRISAQSPASTCARSPENVTRSKEQDEPAWFVVLLVFTPGVGALAAML
jgi:hypothetical protein